MYYAGISYWCKLRVANFGFLLGRCSLIIKRNDIAWGESKRLFQISLSHWCQKQQRSISELVFIYSHEIRSSRFLISFKFSSTQSCTE